MNQRVDIVIPVYKPDKTFEKLLLRLQKQKVRPGKIIVVNTGKEDWEKAEFDKDCMEKCREAGILTELYHITKEEFDHGGTRRWAAQQSDSEYLMCMTQDAVPADDRLIENLLRMMNSDEKIGAAYARQLPAKDCSYIERYTRKFNYGSESRVNTEKDFDTLGIKACFCSNVCAIYRKEIYQEVGGFVSRTIFNEDMICAGTMLQNGYKVAYAADAKVIHSHNYSGMQQLRRNFDLGVSQAEHPELFATIKSESEGIRLVKKTAGHLVRSGRVQDLPRLIWQSGCKYLGYRLGKAYHRLPKRVICKISTNQAYWSQNRD